MSERYSTLRELGVYGDFTAEAQPRMNGCGPQAYAPAIPSLSAYGEFTPITVRSYTVARSDHADMEPDQRRD